jgi:hypothetical protein
MYTMSEAQPFVYAGYYPDTPELDNNCNFFSGFYMDFSVNYATFGNNGYNPSGSDVELCFMNYTAVPANIGKIYVSDYLKKVTNWPFMQNPGPVTPNVPMTELYNSPNGFKTELKMNGTNPNIWCISGEDFGSWLTDFKG